MNGETDLQKLIASINPCLNMGSYVFCTVKVLPTCLDNLVLFFRESEGFTIVCTSEFANINQWDYCGIFSWLTLEVHSSLEAVGLTASFSKVLAENNISCNVVAGFYHDHIFVPEHQASEAKSILEQLSKNSKSAQL